MQFQLILSHHKQFCCIDFSRAFVYFVSELPFESKIDSQDELPFCSMALTGSLNDCGLQRSRVAICGNREIRLGGHQLNQSPGITSTRKSISILWRRMEPFGEGGLWNQTKMEILTIVVTLPEIF
jgi:hypothetical protein